MIFIAPAQAVGIARRFYLANVLFAFVGWTLHALGQVDAIARAKGLKRINLLEANWIRLAIRGFSMVCFFLLWMYHPSVVAGAIAKIGIPLSPTAQAFLTLPIVPATSGLFGLVFDSIVTFIPWFKNISPPVEDDNKAPADPDAGDKK